jgi:hypothetical protein
VELPTAAATESYNQDTTDSLEPSLASPLRVRRSSTTETYGMEGMSSSGGLEIGISCLTGPHFETGGQKHTHTNLLCLLRKYKFLHHHMIVALVLFLMCIASLD